MKKANKEVKKNSTKPLLIKKEELKSTSKKIQRVATSVPGFDKLIQGGFEKGSTNLIVGGSGSGKTIFCVQFLINAMKKGEKCLFITFEEKKKEFYKNMYEFGWDLEQYEKKGLFTFLEYTPEKVKTMLEEGGGIIESIVLREKISRMVIDSVTSFELLFEEDLKKREAALELFGMLRKWDVTSLLTYEGDPTKDERAASRTLEFESDSIILVYFIRPEKERRRFLEILKMRGTKHATEIYPVEIGKSGFTVSNKPVSKKINI